MLVIHTNHPDNALHSALSLSVLDTFGVEEESRNGPVIRFSTPVTTVWEPGFECVSTDANRDANPFLHYIEAFWMLAGRNDVETVAKLASNMRNYSDDGETLHGAYGHRWRNWFKTDQISEVIDELRSNPKSRRCVIQMWDGAVDLEAARQGKKDTPCNTAIYFDPIGDNLNMTVTNRSNDMVWGAYGANVVHMSFLHSYISHQVGKKTGAYYQMSNNLHLYKDFPITAKLVNLHTKEVTVKRAEYKFIPITNMFADVKYSDSQFRDMADRILSNFVDPNQQALQETDCKSLNMLITLCEAFNIYKKDGAFQAVQYLNHFNWESAPANDPYGKWVAASVAWLRRRPSFVQPN
jgi:thymidylate synthase